jgi:aspartate aminotransferase
MVKFASRLDGIQTSGVRKMFEMAKSGSINLGLGQPDFDPPKEAIEGVKKAMESGKNAYGSVFGIRELRDAIAGYCKKYSKGITGDSVTVTVGGSEALNVTAQTFYDKDDEVLIPDPGFVFYRPHAMLTGAKPVSYPLAQENGFVPTQDDLLKRITPRTKAIVVNFPNNPCGSTLTKAQRDMIVDIAKDRDLIIVSDEVYDMIVYDSPHESFLGHYDKLVYINSFSKTFAATGWRIGYFVCPDPAMHDKMSMMHYYTVACAPTPLQYGLLDALEKAKDFPKRMLKEFTKRREVIVKLLNEMDGVKCLRPNGAFYVFPKVDVRMSDTDLALEILNAGVICSPGISFGPAGAGHLRFSYANSVENIEKGMAIVSKVIKGHRK